MPESFPVLSAVTLDALATAAEQGSFKAPFTDMQVGRFVSKSELRDAVLLLDRLARAGLVGPQLAASLRLAATIRQVEREQPQPKLVWSDLDLQGSRDTTVVCDELFREAKKYVLLSTYSIGHWAKPGEMKGNPALLALADRMSAVPSLVVRLFVNVSRKKHQESATATEIEQNFAKYFLREVWPWERLPEVYYDPRSLELDFESSACLHAKCVVIDDKRAFVTSANLTEAAQDRNIEAGVLLDDVIFARTLRKQFEALIGRGYVRRLAI